MACFWIALGEMYPEEGSPGKKLSWIYANDDFETVIDKEFYTYVFAYYWIF